LHDNQGISNTVMVERKRSRIVEVIALLLKLQLYLSIMSVKCTVYMCHSVVCDEFKF